MVSDKGGGAGGGQSLAPLKSLLIDALPYKCQAIPKVFVKMMIGCLFYDEQMRAFTSKIQGQG